MNLNVFSWIRDGVKQSVLLGFSDAIEQIGVPPNGEELSPAMKELVAAGGAAPKRVRGGAKKRLGRTLKDMNPED